MEWPFNKINYMLFGIGVVSIIIGYLLIAYNPVNSVMSTQIGPIILFLGYCVIIPIAIIHSPKK